MANTKITTAVIKDDAITTAKIADDAVTGALIADDVALAGNPTTTTQSAGNNTTRIATTAFVTTAVTNLVDSAPAALDTLNELAAAMGDDANFSTTVTNSIATKAALAGAAFTGDVSVTGSSSGSTVLTLTSNALADTPLMVFQRTGGAVAGKLAYEDGNTAISFGTTTAHELKLLTSNTERMRVESGGNAIIGGTTSSLPSSGTPGLEVAGSGFSGMAAIARYDNNAYGPALFLVKSRASNASGHTIVADDDNLGAISWTPDDGTNRDTYAASIQAKVDGTPGANDMPTRLEFLTTGDGAASPTTRLTIDSSGNVGIGRADPGQLLEVHKSSGGDQTVAKFSAHNYGDTGKTFIEIGTEYGDGSSRIGSFNNSGNKSVLVFDVHSNTSGSFIEAMRINSSTEIQIGGTTNAGFIDFDGTNLQLNTQRNPNSGAFVNSSKSHAFIGLQGTNGGSTITFGTASSNNTTSTSRMVIESGGHVEITNGNLKMNSGNGIDFSDTADTANASNINELLDDYEEGTFTPEFHVEGQGQASLSDATGEYIKVGRMVTVTLRAGISNPPNAASNRAWEFRNLPFTSSNHGGSNTLMTAISLRLSGINTSTAVSSFQGFLYNNANHGRIEAWSGDNPVNSSVYMDGANAAISVTYCTA